MKVLGIRFCHVSTEAESLSTFLESGLGLAKKPVETDDGGFMGAIFPAGDSWVEVWNEGPGMPAGTMLQIVVDDADAWAEQVRKNGIEPQGPTDMAWRCPDHVSVPSRVIARPVSGRLPPFDPGSQAWQYEADPGAKDRVGKSFRETSLAGPGLTNRRGRFLLEKEG